jgi:uncharacterized protein YecE (DUF72 family)
MRAFVGTSGWNYKHWIDVIYPKGLPASQWLARYSETFDTVEVNNSFYRLPEKTVFEKWAQIAPPQFTFAVKASRYLTHILRLKEPEEPIERLISRAEGLGPKLGPILYQLPPFWKLNLERFEHFLKLLPSNVRHVFEFRNETWQTDAVFDLLREHNVGYCIMSAPDLPCKLIATSDFVYIRMHNGGGATEGNYTDESLGEWAATIRDFLRSRDVYVYFNNDYKGFAVRNALRLRDMIV